MSKKHQRNKKYSITAHCRPTSNKKERKTAAPISKTATNKKEKKENENTIQRKAECQCNQRDKQRTTNKETNINPARNERKAVKKEENVSNTPRPSYEAQNENKVWTKKQSGNMLKDTIIKHCNCWSVTELIEIKVKTYK